MRGVVIQQIYPNQDPPCTLKLGYMVPNSGHLGSLSLHNCSHGFLIAGVEAFVSFFSVALYTGTLRSPI